MVGLPKTVDNDIVPIRQSLGAVTAAEQGAIFFENVVNEGDRQPAHAGHPRGDGPQLRLADRGDRPRLPRAARAAGILAGLQPRPGAQGDRRRLRARDGDRHRGGGDAPEVRDGPQGLRPRLRQRRGGRRRHRQGDRGARRARSTATPSGTSSSTRSMSATGSPSSSPSSSAPSGRWCRNPAISPARPPPMPRICA